jgi:hypothetical protein
MHKAEPYATQNQEYREAVVGTALGLAGESARPTFNSMAPWLPGTVDSERVQNSD